MGWETRNGRRYYYEKERRDGRVVSVYRGSGALAECVAQLDALDREKRLLEKFLRDGERELSAAAESELVRFGESLDSWLREALSRAGYHRPNRGPWRRRRMSQTEAKDAVAAPAVPTGAERDALFRRARKGDDEVLQAIRTIFDAEPATLRRFGNMRVHARDALIALVTSNDDGQDVAVTEALERMMEKARIDLAGPDPSPMESLLASRAAQDWLAVHIFEFFASSDRKGKRTIAQARWHESRMDRAHSRFLASMRTLAQVKRLLRKPVPSIQINAVNAQAVFGAPETLPSVT